MTNIKPPERVWTVDWYGWKPEDGHTDPLWNETIVADDPLGGGDEYILSSSVQSRIKLAVLEERLSWYVTLPSSSLDSIRAEIQKLKKEIGE